MAASYHRPAAFAAAIDAITETLSSIGTAHDIGPMRRFRAALQASMGGMRQIRAMARDVALQAVPARLGMFPLSIRAQVPCCGIKDRPQEFVDGCYVTNALVNRILARYAPVQVVRCGRVLALLMATAMVAGYVSGLAAAESTAIMAYFLGLFILMAAPGQRPAELLGAQAVWMTVAEFLAAAQSGQMLLWRWAVSIAALSLILLSGKIQHLRRAARSRPYRALGDLEPRVPAASSAVLDGQARALRRKAACSSAGAADAA